MLVLDGRMGAGVCSGVLVSCGLWPFLCGVEAPSGGVLGCIESSSLRVFWKKLSTEGDRC